MKTKNIYLAITIVSFLGLSCSDGKVNDQAANKNELPNIVMIISDDQAWTDYGFTGHEHIQTPNIDKLASESLTFTRGYVPTSLCAPSLASMITGLYPRQHMVLGNDRVLPGEDVSIRRDPKTNNSASWRVNNYKPVIEHFKGLNTLPKMLKEKGYLSFQTGKWWIGNYTNGGFDQGMTHGDPERKGRHGDFGLEIGRKGMDTLNSYIDFALEEEKPFFMWYAPFLPHSPHNPPDSLLQKYLPVAPSEYVAKYWAMCEWFDITCGQLIDYIEAKGEMENTLFVYVCDNGWVQNLNDSRYNEISKRAPYDYGIRTPIMFKWKGKITPRLDKNLMASSIDIVPTILNLLDIEKPNELDGIDVLDNVQLKNRKAIFGEIYAHDFNTVDSSLFYRMVVTDPYKLVLPDPTNKPTEEVQLFNLIADPFEKENLVSSNTEIVAELKNMIDESWNEN